ncbi:MAG TPA: hypothetical protein VIJ70_09635 [Gaiellaceae bacterium]
MTERAGYEEPSERGRLLRWLDPGPEPAPASGVSVFGSLPRTLTPAEATVAAVDELLPLRIAGRW